MNYFVINKQMDYERGYLNGLEYRRGRLRLKKDAESGCFFSRVFDSQEDGCIWHRFTLDIGMRKGSGLRTSFYCFDVPDLVWRNRKTTVEALLRDPEIPPEEKRRALEPRCALRTLGRTDILLHETAGRYMVVEVELERRESDNSVGDMCLYFPKETWMRFLPGIYSRHQDPGEFTDRFLSIFQSMHEDRERDISGSAGMLHPASADRRLLEELAGWYDLKDLYLWTDAKLRALVMNAPELTKKRGTVAGLKKYLQLYLGEEPAVDEEPDNPWGFSVLVPAEYFDDPREHRSLMRIIGHMKPAGMTVQIKASVKKKRNSDEMHLGIDSMLEGEDTGREQE